MDGGGGKASQIFCLTWVKRGTAKLSPDQITLNSEELKGVIDSNDAVGQEGDQDSWEDLEDSDNDIPAHKNSKQGDVEESSFTQKEEDDLKEYDMDNYDDEEGDFSGVSGLVMFTDNIEDPYITKKQKSEEQQESSDSEEEREEKSSIKIQPDDNLLVCARCGQHSSVLEVYVYNHNSGDFYVHHDIPLMETPLCMQRVGFDPGTEDASQGNLLAVGNFNSTIDIWDLDIINTLEPVISIGAKKKKSSKRGKNTAFQHDNAILDLAWTDNAKDQLASSSADTVVALWDLEFGKCTRTFRNHKSKVQTIEWRPKSENNLISGAFDGQVILFDTKTSKNVTDWSLDGEIERVVWNYGNENYFSATTDNGLVYYLDCRKPKSYLQKWKAHKGAIPGLSITSKPHDKNGCLLYTASSDGFVKLWDLSESESKLIYSKNMKMGMVHCCQINPNEQLTIACGGQKDSVRIWDISKTDETAQYLGLSCGDQAAGSDTLNPLGGGGENDADVLNYIEGEDYIDQNKLDRIAVQNRNKEKALANNIKKTNTDRNGAAEISPGSSVVVQKKKRKKKRKTIPNTVNMTSSSG